LKVILNNQEQSTDEDKEAIALGKAIQRKGLTEVVEDQTITTGNMEQCQFMGSKNSDKYHLMSCRFADQINQKIEFVSNH